MWRVVFGCADLDGTNNLVTCIRRLLHRSRLQSLLVRNFFLRYRSTGGMLYLSWCGEATSFHCTVLILSHSCLFLPILIVQNTATAFGCLLVCQSSLGWLNTLPSCSHNSSFVYWFPLTHHSSSWCISIPEATYEFLLAPQYEQADLSSPQTVERDWEKVCVELSFTKQRAALFIWLFSLWSIKDQISLNTPKSCHIEHERETDEVFILSMWIWSTTSYSEFELWTEAKGKANPRQHNTAALR